MIKSVIDISLQTRNSDAAIIAIIIIFIFSGCAAILHPDTDGTAAQREAFAKSERCRTFCISLIGDQGAKYLLVDGRCVCGDARFRARQDGKL